jgi:DNA transposition AAA+ family ATPase
MSPVPKRDLNLDDDGDTAVIDSPHDGLLQAAITWPELHGVPPAPPTAPAPKFYSAADNAQAKAVADWLRANGKSRSWLASKLRISSATVSTLLNGKYPAPPAEHLARMQAVLDVEAERISDGTPGYVEGSVHKLAFVVADRTRKAANFGVLCGHVGVGKTRTLKEYATRRPQTLLVEANPQMTAGSLLIELLEQLAVTVPAGMDRKFQALTKALAGTNYLLIVDEAENMSGQALHYLRRIRDKAGVGVVLAGTPKLQALIKPEHGQFDQIRSRVAMWPATIQAISRDDADDMVREALRDHSPTGAEVPDDVLDALWAYCDGSARVLMESLLPALRDYGLAKQTALSPKLVDAIAKNVLFMVKRSPTAAARAAA